MKVIYDKKHLLHNPEKCQFDHTEISIRTENILAELLKEPKKDFEICSPNLFPKSTLLSVHSEDYLKYLSNAYDRWIAAGNSKTGVLPDSFSVQNSDTIPEEILQQAGWFCFDCCTPILENTFDVACMAANCALTGADFLLAGEKLVYALCRPPGHHAGKNYCGGFCYLNNVALAAARLSENDKNKIAVLDIDYHHGNGTQEIFYECDNVLYVSLHADTRFAFPYYWGAADETGTAKGKGYNINIPLDIYCNTKQYLNNLNIAINHINKFNADFLIISFGADIFSKDPLGTFDISEEDFSKIGEQIKKINLPTLVVQEGGYNLDNIGKCATNFLCALTK